MDELKNIAVIDLFCGIGGLSHGFVMENFNVVAGIDNDSHCKYAFEINNNSKFIQKDIQLLSGEELNSLFDDKLKILVGCAPCQPFSSYSFKQKEKDENKWGLLYSFSRLVEETLPTIISMENVTQLLHFNNPPVFEHFCDKLRSLDYHVSPYEVYCPDYGIPQRRKRLVLIASRLGNIALVDKTHSYDTYVTVRQAIGNLSPIAAGETDKMDYLHRAKVLTALNLSRIRATSEGGSWREWDENLQLDCHKKASGKSYGSVYGRMRWDDVAPTMTTHCTGLGNGRFGHPEQDRAITLREAALFQTFPTNYDFLEDKQNFNIARVSRHIGNAVPPLLGQVIAKKYKNPFTTT